MALKEYQRKRSFDKTSEPKGGKAKSNQNLQFVVQKHQASHLHYDFRLENNGVLLSWAVPKGPSLDPNDKRLAMRVEDHPYDYKDFEGVIPKDNYGAGQVIVWDHGNYEAIKPGSKSEQEKALRRDLHQGKLSFVLHGDKLRGEFSLVKTKRPKQDNAWLLIKKKDKFSSKDDVTQQDKSVVGHQTVEQVGQTKKLTDKDWRQFIKRHKLKKAKLKRPVQPMLATLTSEAFDDGNWLFEVKWDGYRAIAERGQSAKLYSRNHKDFSQAYPTVFKAIKQIKWNAVLDGEIVMLDGDGRSNFQSLQNYDARRAEESPVYYVFDLLELDGYDLTGISLLERKNLLENILPESDLIRFSEHIEKNGEKFFDAARDNQLEGIMAKRQDSVYQPGKRVKSWLKIKTSRRQEAVIGGFTEPRGSRKHLGALVMGIYEGKNLVYIGHTGAGLATEQLKALRQKLDKLERQTSPFKQKPKTNAPVHWVSPKLLAEVSFTEWTSGGHMRHPKLVVIRSDKPAQQVSREEPIKPNAAKQSESKTNKKARSSSANQVEFTNLDKVFWPKQKLTKGNLIDYYQTVAEYMLPYLKNRPMTLLRHPNGASSKGFFQKDIDEKTAKGFERFSRYSDSNQADIHYLVTDSKEALLYQAQLGCIEINPWNSTAKTPDQPDWLALDLDPEKIGFDSVVETARQIKNMFDELGVKSFPKTSGKTGIHIYVPLKPRYNYDQVKQLAELLARKVVAACPKITSVERSPSKRQGEIYVDFLQNRLGQTLAAPYSVRPTPEATVAMPLTWRQINRKLKPTDFTMQSVPGIIKKRQDPWADFWKSRITIESIINKL